MAETQFKSVCRFNRLILVVLAVLTIHATWHADPTWRDHVVQGTVLGLDLIVLMLNEFMLKRVVRLKEADSQTVGHLGLFFPLLLSGIIAVSFALTGSFWILGLGSLAFLEAQFLNQPRLAAAIGLGQIACFLLGLPFGYPHLETKTLDIALGLLAWGSCLFYYGRITARLVLTHNSQVGRLQSIAATDVLTGLTNRRQFNNRLHQEIARARRHETALSLALFDLDNFKKLNDFYGHPVGDRILKELGHLIRQNIRESDLPARYGGEEFAIILPETREIEAHDLLERIRVLVAQTVFCLPENPLTISISIGVAQLDPRHHTAFELVELADKALYEAKRQGKNCVVNGSALLPKVLLSRTQTPTTVSLP